MSGMPDIVASVASRRGEAGTSFGALNCQTLKQFPVKTKKPSTLLKLGFCYHQKLLAKCLKPPFNTCAYNTDHLPFKPLFIHSWLWRLQSVRFPGLPSKICPLPYSKSFILKLKSRFCFFAFILSIGIILYRTGSRMSEPWKRPLRKWHLFISPSGERVLSASSCHERHKWRLRYRLHVSLPVGDCFWMCFPAFVQGSASSRGRDALHAGGGKDGRLWTGKLPSQGKFVKGQPVILTMPSWEKSKRAHKLYWNIGATA